MKHSSEPQVRPPRLALRILRWYCGQSARQEELEGDLEELFYSRLERENIPWKANLYFWWNVLRCYKSYAKSKTYRSSFMTSLLKSYLKLALRHSWKNKWSVSINIIGLGMALSMCMFVYMLYAYNLEFDSYYENTENTYRIHSITSHNGKEKRNEFSPIALDDKLRNELSGINQVSSYFTQPVTIKKEAEFFTESAAVVSSDFSEMFELPLWYGSFDEFGDKPVVYLTKPLAIKYFGQEFASGKELTIFFSNEKTLEVTVGGVFNDIPANSSFRFELLISQDDYLRTLKSDPNDWSNDRLMGHYVTIAPNQKEQVTQSINEYVSIQNESREELKIARFELIPFEAPMPSDMIIGATYTNGRTGKEALVVFTTLAFIVFLIACFNLANTTIALIAKRLKEIGVRQTLGSNRNQIIIQFILEMGVISIFAFVIAISSANFTSQSIMGLFGSSFLLQDVDLTGVVLFVIGFLIFTTLAAGILPALYAWKFRPVAIMRKSVKLKGVSWLNKSLTTAQYSFSIVVLIIGITFSQNAEYLNTMDLGYQEEDILSVPIENKYFAQVNREVAQIPGVFTAGASNHVGDFGRYSKRVSIQIDTATHEVRFYGVGEGYLDLMGVRIQSGRGFLKGSQEKNTILVSQSFADTYLPGEDPINQVIKMNGERKTIVGITIDIIDDVVKAAELLPTIIALTDENEFEHLVVKASSGDMHQVEQKVETIWRQYIDQPYTGILQKDFALGGADEESRNIQKIFIAMAILSSILSLIGIFSLVKLNIAKRTKEISIRKVLGSSVASLLFSINKSFLITLMLSLVIGSVVGFVLANSVLDLIYKYHVTASFLASTLSGVSIVFLSLIMIAGVALVPASSNLVEGLRDD